MRRLLTLLALVAALSCSAVPVGPDAPLRIAAFNVDATPPVGSPVAYALTRTILDPLSARGVVLLSDEKPVVLCVVDWIGIANGGQDVWREQLARAAGTTVDRVAVHTVHQHDGRFNFVTVLSTWTRSSLPTDVACLDQLVIG